MKIAIDKMELSKALDIVVKAVPVGKVVMQILEGVLLEADNGKLSLTCNNLETAIKLTVDCEVIQSGRAVVNTNFFHEIVKKMPDEEIDINVNDNEMSVEAGKAVMKLPVAKAEFPEMQQIKELSRFEIDKSIFADMVEKVAFAVYKGDQRPVYTGIKIDIIDGEISVVATDTCTLAVQQRKVNAPNISVLVDGKSLERFSKVMVGEGTVTFVIGERTAMLFTDNMQANIRLVEGNFINYNRYLNTSHEAQTKIEKRILVQSLERALLILEKGENGRIINPLVVNSAADGLLLKNSGQKGAFKEKIPGDIRGSDFKFGIDPQRVLDCVRHIDDKEFIINISDEKARTPMFITPVEGNSFTYIIPIVLTGEK